MKVKCPTCGYVGVDRHSLSSLRREDEATFKIRGRSGRRAVRKCLNCGSGVYVKLIPPRYEAIPPDLWDEMEAYFEQEMAAHDERRARFRAESDAQAATEEDTK